MYRIVALSFFLVVLACGTADDCDETFNSPFEINQGEEYCLEDGSTLHIIEIISSYCPCFADCIWQGETVVNAQRITSNMVEEISFHEELVEENPVWGRLSSVETSDECTPQPTKVLIIISN